eukprot:g8370.t1
MFEAATDDAPLESVEQVADALVQRKLLTPYQAQAACKGKAKRLVLGNYLIIDKIGEGGMGLVLKARHRRMDRIVALKVMSSRVTQSPEALRRFHREVRAVARLSHPNIVHAYDADETKGVHYLVMEYVDGVDLATMVKKHGPMSPETAVTCIIQAARGLDYAHSQGVIHRDIKPANLLLAKSALESASVDQAGSSAVKVLDMGLARLEVGVGDTSTNVDLTGTGTIMGTVDYMSPEQALDTKSADARSDIYSLGCTLYFLMTGQTLFEGDTVMKRLLAHREKPVPKLSTAFSASGMPSISEPGSLSAGWHPPLVGVDAVFQRMVAKAPEDRYQTMMEVISALQSCLTGAAATSPGDSGEGSDLALRDFLAHLNASETTADGPPKFDPNTVSPTEQENAGMRRAETLHSVGVDDTQRVQTPGRRPKSRGSQLAQRKTFIGMALGGIVLAAIVLIAVLTRSGDDSGDRGDGTNRSGVALGSSEGKSTAGKQVGNNKTVANADAALRITPADGWVDLLDRIDLTRDIPRQPVDGGAWRRVDGGLRSPKQEFARIRAPLAARTGYQVRAEFTRRSGNEAANFYLPVATRQVMFVVDGFSDEPLSGLQAVKKRNRPIPGVTGVDTFRMENGKRYTILLTVSTEGNNATIEAELGGAGTFSFKWTGAIGDLSLIDQGFQLDDSRLLGLCAWDSVIDFHKFEFRAISENATWTRGAEIGPSVGKRAVSAAKGFALSFDGMSHYVEVESLKLDAYPVSQPLTIEAFVTLRQPNTSNVVSWLGPSWIALFHAAGDWGAARLVSRNTGLWRRADSAQLGKRTHIAAVWDGKQFQLFLDGKKQAVRQSAFNFQPTGGGLFIGGAPLDKLTGHNEGRWFGGIVDELRISKTIRYKADFTPEARFITDRDTKPHFILGMFRNMNQVNDEIENPRAALLTPRGRGAVATVRLLGACHLIDEGEPRLFQSAGGRVLREYDIGRVVYGQWGRDLPEDVVVCRIDEATTDVHCHGGDAAAQRILDDLRTAGCTVQSWQEISTATAGLLETELVEALGRAETSRTAGILLEQQSGVLRGALETLQALSREPSFADAGEARSELIGQIEALLHWSQFGLHLTQPWKVVIAGRPNAGKSSLINALLGYARSIVYDEPGTTRDVVTAQTAFDGWPVELADTAGIRDSVDELESAGIGRARQNLAAADCRVLLLDLSRRRSLEEEQLLAEWPSAIRVGAKRDLPNLWGFPLPADLLRVSTVTETGFDELAAEIVSRLIPEVPPPATAIPVTRRQVALLRQARAAIEAADTTATAQAIDEILT